MCISLQEAMQQINSTPAVLPAINSTSRMQAPFQERAFHSIGCTADDKFFIGCAVTINSILAEMQPINSSLAVQQELILQKLRPQSIHSTLTAPQHRQLLLHIIFHFTFIYIWMAFLVSKQACIWWYLKRPRPPLLSLEY